MDKKPIILEMREGISKVDDLITPDYIEARVNQLIDECQKIGVPCAVIMDISNTPMVYSNYTAYDNAIYMTGLLEWAKTALNSTIEE